MRVIAEVDDGREEESASALEPETETHDNE